MARKHVHKGGHTIPLGRDGRPILPPMKTGRVPVRRHVRRSRNGRVGPVRSHTRRKPRWSERFVRWITPDKKKAERQRGIDEKRRNQEENDRLSDESEASERMEGIMGPRVANEEERAQKEQNKRDADRTKRKAKATIRRLRKEEEDAAADEDRAKEAELQNRIANARAEHAYRLKRELEAAQRDREEKRKRLDEIKAGRLPEHATRGEKRVFRTEQRLDKTDMAAFEAGRATKEQVARLVSRGKAPPPPSPPPPPKEDSRPLLAAAPVTE